VCDVPCAVDFFAAARQCAGVTEGVECTGENCYANGAWTYAVAGELRDPDGAVCLKRWSTATGLAWQTGPQQLRLDTGPASSVDGGATGPATLRCPDGSEQSVSAATQDTPSACDPIDEPGRTCGAVYCGDAPAICPSEGCLCRESGCAKEFFDGVRECAGLVGGETCTRDESAAKVCYANGAYVVGDADGRQLYAADGTLCLTVSVGPVTFPSRGYVDRRGNSLTVDDTGEVVTCPDTTTTEPGCGSGARQNFDDACDPSAIFDPLGCCAAGTCGP
jgi:hypothetical protein